MIESGRFSLFSRGTANEKAGLVPLGEEQCPAYFSSLRRDTLKSLSGHVRGPCRADWRSLKYAYCETFYASSCCQVNARFWCNCFANSWPTFLVTVRPRWYNTLV